MSNQKFLSASPTSAIVGESNADGTAIHVTFQDALEHQDILGDSSPHEMNSNTEFDNPPTQTQSQDDNLDHQPNEDTNMHPASRSRQSISKRELNNLR